MALRLHERTYQPQSTANQRRFQRILEGYHLQKKGGRLLQRQPLKIIIPL